MNAFHERVARVALASIGRYGFVLAGGYAVQMHGIIERLSDDVDLFTDEPDLDKFAAASAAAVKAWETDGLTVELDTQSDTFARYYLSDRQQSMKAELSHDWRSEQPVQLAIGPVLSRDDSVGNKVCAVFSRGEARDFIDVHAALTVGGYTHTELEELGAIHDGGFEPTIFAQSLRRCLSHNDSEYGKYGLAANAVRTLQADLLAWATEITNRS